jgi:hypothetical protein
MHRTSAELGWLYRESNAEGLIRTVSRCNNCQNLQAICQGLVTYLNTRHRLRHVSYPLKSDSTKLDSDELPSIAPDLE